MEIPKGVSPGDFFSAPGTFKWWRKRNLLHFYLVLGSVSQPKPIPLTPTHAPDREFHCGQVCVPNPHGRYILLHIMVLGCIFFFKQGKSWKEKHLFVLFLCQGA